MTKADAVARILGIEARLIKVESPSVTQAIECAGRFSVEPQNVQAEPAATESTRRELCVESDMPGSVERIGAAAFDPSLVMQGDQQLQRGVALILVFDPLEHHFKLFREILYFPLHVIAVLGTKRGEIGRPGMTAEVDERTGVHFGLRGFPSLLPQTAPKSAATEPEHRSWPNSSIRSRRPRAPESASSASASSPLRTIKSR